MLDKTQCYCPEDSRVNEEKEKRAAEHFIRGLIVTGEAAERLPDGKLPSGATHEIIESKEGELPKVRRRRFSLV